MPNICNYFYFKQITTLFWRISILILLLSFNKSFLKADNFNCLKYNIIINELIVKNNPIFNKDTIENYNILDTFGLQNTKLPAEKFKYGDVPRYTITGELPNLKNDVKLLPAIILGTTYTGIFIVQHKLQQNTIWKKVGDFHIAEDIDWFLYQDKFGHVYGGYTIAYLFGESLLTTGFNWETSTLIGGAMGLLYSTYVEVLDGFSVDFGFSPSDFYSDLIGAGFYVAQYYVPFLQNFTPKFMYVNPHWLNEKKRANAESFIDDYSSQTFWLSINVYNLLPESWKKYWIPWLDISVGYAAYGLCNPTTGITCDNYSEKINDAVYGNRRIIIALDWNLPKLLPDDGAFWNWFKQGLNFFKLPSPAIEIGNKVKFYILYPFSIK